MFRYGHVEDVFDGLSGYEIRGGGLGQEASGPAHGNVTALVQHQGHVGESDDFGDGVGDVEHGNGEIAVDCLEVAEDATTDGEVE